jgi:hypothetical protein
MVVTTGSDWQMIGGLVNSDGTLTRTTGGPESNEGYTVVHPVGATGEYTIHFAQHFLHPPAVSVTVNAQNPAATRGEHSTWQIGSGANTQFDDGAKAAVVAVDTATAQVFVTDSDGTVSNYSFTFVALGQTSGVRK